MNVMDYALKSLDVPPRPPLLIDAELSADFNNVTIRWNRSLDDGMGFDDVIRYDVFTSSSYGGPYGFKASIPADGSLEYSWIHLNAGGIAGPIFYRVEAYDSISLSSSSYGAVKYYWEFNTGIHLASIPIPLPDTTLPTVLQTMDYNIVWSYDTLDMTDHWKTYSEAKSPNGDLTELDNTMGFWVHTLTDTAFTAAAVIPACTDIQLYTGWNLVSFPAFRPMAVADALSGITYEKVEGFDPLNPPSYMRVLFDTDLMMPGYGYWIKVTANQLLTICN
jgi:hypothetical protein